MGTLRTAKVHKLVNGKPGVRRPFDMALGASEDDGGLFVVIANKIHVHISRRGSYKFLRCRDGCCNLRLCQSDPEKDDGEPG